MASLVNKKRGFIFLIDEKRPPFFQGLFSHKPTINVDTVVTIARSDEISVCSRDSIDTLAKMSLAARAEAGIEESGLSYGPSTALTVSVDVPGRIILSGLVNNEKARLRAEDVLRGVQGVESVDNLIRLRSADRHA